MANRLNVPDDLESLIEKRNEIDRRQSKDNIDSITEDAVSQEQRVSCEKRKGKDRRKVGG
ncbi:MAG: hypothetical protein MK171_03795 [Pirellulales bacterium]|nr:hypothetical protein [Pirellulales bacterium]